MIVEIEVVKGNAGNRETPTMLDMEDMIESLQRMAKNKGTANDELIAIDIESILRGIQRKLPLGFNNKRMPWE